MTFKTLNKLLICKFPELKEEFLEYTHTLDEYDTGCTVTFEDIFMPFVEKCIYLKNEKTINRIYDFIEELSYSDDEYVQIVVDVAILEKFSSYVDSGVFTKYLRTNSLKRYNEIIPKND